MQLQIIYMIKKNTKTYTCSFICQDTSTRRQRRDLFGLWVVTTYPIT